MKIKTTKPYLIEGQIVNKNTTIEIIERKDDVDILLLFEELYEEFHTLFRLFNEYTEVLHENRISKNPLTEERTKKEQDLIEDIELHIKRISKCVGVITKALNPDRKVSNVEESNSNLVDIIGIYDNLKKRHSNLKSKDSRLNATFNLMEKSIDSLDSRIKEYNATEKSEGKLYTKEEALKVHNGNTPS